MKINNKMNSFSLNHTNYCKGIAIIFMFVHHLFQNVPNIGYIIGDMALSQNYRFTEMERTFVTGYTCMITVQPST